MLANLNFSPENNSAVSSSHGNRFLKLLDYKILPSKKDLYSVIRFNGKTVHEINDPEERKIISNIIERIKETNLTDKIFSLPNPLFNIINTAIRPWVVEFDARNIVDDILGRLSDIYLRAKNSL
jgi:hypothetical protein